MAHDVPAKPQYVFISYSSKDEQYAHAVQHFLEAARIRCWISEENIRTGEDWDDAIADAIEDCSLMVLVVSPNSLSSTQVKNEFHMALQCEKKIFPFRIKEVELKRGWGLQLKRMHWIDALTEPLEQHLKKLSEDVQEYLTRKADREEEEPPEQADLPVPAQPEQVSESDLSPATGQPELVPTPSVAEGQQAADLSHELAEAVGAAEPEVVAPPSELPPQSVSAPSEPHVEPPLAQSEEQPGPIRVSSVGEFDQTSDLNRKLLRAAQIGELWQVQDLVARGAGVNVTDNDGYTPLMWAAFKGHPEVVKVLLEKGADVNTRDNDGYTPLMAAAFKGHLEVVQLLLETGADARVKDEKGLTALNLASARGHKQVVELLRGREVVDLIKTKSRNDMTVSPETAPDSSATRQAPAIPLPAEARSESATVTSGQPSESESASHWLYQNRYSMAAVSLMALVGVLGLYTGAPLVYPASGLIGAVAGVWIASKKLRSELQPYVAAISIISGLWLGQFAWSIREPHYAIFNAGNGLLRIWEHSAYAALVLSPYLGLLLQIVSGYVALVLLPVGVTWLIERPGVRPVGFLIAYELISLLVGLYLFAVLPGLKTSTVVAGILRILLSRGGAVGFLICGYSVTNKQKQRQDKHQQVGE